MMLSLILAAAAPALPSPPVPPQVEVPADRGPQTVLVMPREFAAGGESGWHTHPGIEIGFVVAGETEMRLADGTARRYAAGQSFVIPRGAIHNGINSGTDPARLIVTYVIDRDQPVRTPVSPPEPK